MNTATREQNSSRPAPFQEKNNFQSQLPANQESSQMKQIQLGYYGSDMQNRPNNVYGGASASDASPSSNTNLSSNKVKKVFIYTGQENQQDSKPNSSTVTPFVINPPVSLLSREQQSSSPLIQTRQTTAKGILKQNRMSPFMGQGASNTDPPTKEKEMNQSFTSADDLLRKQHLMSSKEDQNNTTNLNQNSSNIYTKGGESIQLTPLDQRKANAYTKQKNLNINNINTNQNSTQFQSQNSTMTNLRKQQSNSSNEGAYSDQTHYKPSSQHKNHSMIMPKQPYGPPNEHSFSVFQSGNKKLNHSVDFSTTSNGGISDINTTITQQKTPFLSPDVYNNSSPLFDKVANSQHLNKESHTHSYTEGTPFRATKQKFKAANNASFSEFQNSSYLQNTSMDNIVMEDEKTSDQKFGHSQSYLRKRIQSIDNQMPHGSLPHINEEVNEENGNTYKESNLATEEVNRKKRMLLERLKKGNPPNKFHYDEHYDNKKLEDKLYDPSSISIYHPSRNLYDHKNPLRAYQIRSNIPLANTRIVTDPNTYTHQLYYKANQKRQKDQERVIQLLEEQDKIMNRMITKYQKRAVQEENSLKVKLQELEKDRDQLVKLKEQEQMLGLMHVNLSQKVDQFKKNMNHYNSSMSPNMPQLRPNMENAFTDMQDLAFLDSILKQAQAKDLKQKSRANSSKHRNKSLITTNYNNKIL